MTRLITKYVVLRSYDVAFLRSQNLCEGDEKVSFLKASITLTFIINFRHIYTSKQKI